jgi:AraC-like DNA-binding protein
MFSIPENVLLFLSAFTTFQGCLLALILYFHPKSDKSVNTFLALYIFFTSAPSIVLIWQYFFSWEISLFVQPFLLLTGPLLYLYVRSFKETISWKKTWPHFILFAICTGVTVFFYFKVGVNYPSGHNVPQEVLRHPFYYLPVISRSAQRIVYYFAAYKILVSYQRSIRQLFSDTSRINLAWVSWLINGYLVLIVLIIVLSVRIFQHPESYNTLIFIVDILVMVYVYLAALKGIFQPTIWQLHGPVTKERLEAEMRQAEKIVVDRTGGYLARDTQTRNEKIEEITGRIKTLVEDEKLYLEPELTLQNLADRLHYPPFIISVAINEGMKKSFYELINQYRIEEAKRLLQKPANKNRSILSVAEEAGFSSATIFHVVFKRFTGLAPMEFRDQ